MAWVEAREELRRKSTGGSAKVFNKLKEKVGKLDKKALAMACGLMIISWAALPIVYLLIVRKKKAMKEVKPKEEEKDGNMG